MPIYYKFDIAKAMRDAGNPLTGQVEKSIRYDEPVQFSTLCRICNTLHCQPGDIIGYLPLDEFAKYREQIIHYKAVSKAEERDMLTCLEVVKLKNRT